MNICPMRDDFEVLDPKQELDSTVAQAKALNEKVGIVIEDGPHTKHDSLSHLVLPQTMSW